FPNVSGTVFFLASDGSHGPELWKTDGTAAGTGMIEDLWPGNLGSLPGYLTYPLEMSGTVFFAAKDGSESVAALWRSHGTAATTMRVKDAPVGNVDSSPTGLVLLNDDVLFAANDGISGNELWKSDGTVSGTILVRDINPDGDSSPALLTKVNGTLFFGANDGFTNGLWKSDGTTAGTVVVKGYLGA